jgi:ribosomal protein S18 acetylase RimI-like enzyme
MKTGVTKRTALSTDRAFLERVYASTRADELKLTDWTDLQKAAFTSQQFAAQDAYYRQHYPTAEFLVIELDGQPAGRLYVDRWVREIRIMDIALLAEFRRRGLGTALLRELMEEAQRSQKSLSIHVEKFNPALALYQRLGFAVVEDKGVYLLMAWHAGESAPASR